MYEIERREFAPSPRECINEERRCARMILVPNRVLQSHFVDAFIRHAREIRHDARHFGEDLRRVAIIPFGIVGTTEAELEPPGEVAQDQPVGSCLAAGRLCRTYALHAPVGVGKGPLDDVIVGQVDGAPGAVVEGGPGLFSDPLPIGGGDGLVYRRFLLHTPALSCLF